MSTLDTLKVNPRYTKGQPSIQWLNKKKVSQNNEKNIIYTIDGSGNAALSSKYNLTCLINIDKYVILNILLHVCTKLSHAKV